MTMTGSNPGASMTGDRPAERAALVERNAPREYRLDEPGELRRLHREAWGYLRTCHHKHGTDWEGRKFAIDALAKLAGLPDDRPAVEPNTDGPVIQT